jgi:protein-tyrosine-phosphatase
LAAAVFAALGSAPAFAADASAKGPPTVAFICSHGSIKSLMAAMRFNRLAEERGISVRAISRAANTDSADEKVPDPVAVAMTKDGYYVDEIKPKVLTHEEASKAIRVVHISLEDPTHDPDAKEAAGLSVERWNGIPSALRDYASTKRMVNELVDKMVDEFASKQISEAKK